MTGKERPVDDLSEFIDRHRGLIKSRESDKATSRIVQALLQYYGPGNEGSRS